MRSEEHPLRVDYRTASKPTDPHLTVTTVRPNEHAGSERVEELLREARAWLARWFGGQP